MAGENISPNMNMPVPGVGVTQGPTWAADLNSSLNIVDQHDHTPGNGVQITPEGLNINSDLSFLQNNAILVRSLRFSPQTAVLGLATDLGCIYNVNGDLYYNDNIGNQIRITQSGGVAGTPGSISGLTSPASAAYVSGSSSFVWQSAANTAAAMDAGPYKMRNLTVSANSVQIAPPASIAADYVITLPNAPASTQLLSMDSSGNILTTTNLNQLVPSGVVSMYMGASAPSGYLLCDGSSYLKATYPNLYTAIGDASGSADATHFNVPDLRGMFVRGVTGASSNDPDAASRTAQATGGNSGNNVGSVQGQATALNGISLTDPGHTHTFDNRDGGGFGVFAASSAPGGTPRTTTMTTVTTGVTISTTDTETRPINVYVNYIIKT